RAGRPQSRVSLGARARARRRAGRVRRRGRHGRHRRPRRPRGRPRHARHAGRGRRARAAARNAARAARHVSLFRCVRSTTTDRADANERQRLSSDRLSAGPLRMRMIKTQELEGARRRTKIVATLGPSTDDPAVLERMIVAGADVLRINFSHGTSEQQRKRIDTAREVAARAGRCVALMGDLQGPKIRIESFAKGSVQLEAGQPFALDMELDPNAGDERAVNVAYPQLVDDVEPGDVLLLDDGQIVLQAEAVSRSRIDCRVLQGGELSSKKGLNKRGGGLSAPALTDKDRADIETAAKTGLDFVAVSFARDAADMDEARQLLRAAGGHAYLVAKIERSEAVQNIKSIIAASDAIMVARGDLAVEVGYASMTGLQKGLIRLARSQNKVSITATQMLESMISHASPTRAEISDVANAVMD